MKKTIFTFIALAALVMCGCEKDPNDPSGNGNTPDEPVIDITPYLGKHLMTRHTDLTITAMNMFSFPIDRDLDVETVTIKSDPQVEHGIIMSSSDGMYLRGVVDTAGLHLQNDTIAISIESSVAAPGSIFNSFSTILMMLNLPWLACRTSRVKA